MNLFLQLYDWRLSPFLLQIHRKKGNGLAPIDMVELHVLKDHLFFSEVI